MRFLSIGFLLFGLMFFCLASQAKVKISAQLDRTRLSVGERAVLDISIEGEEIDSSRGVELPNLLPCFRVVEQFGPNISTEMQIINGRMSKRERWQMSYVLEALQKGRCEIPVFAYRARDGIYFTSPIEVYVMEPEPLRKGSKRPSGWVPPSDPYLEARVDKSEVYVGEQLVVSWHIYYQQSIYNLSIGQMPLLSDFKVEELETVSQLQPVIESFEGMEYKQAFLKSLALFPLRSGEASIGSLELRVELPSGRRDFFGNMLMEEGRVSSKPLLIQVKPLPEKDKPKDFSLAVGRFSIKSWMNKAEARVNDSFNFYVEISGDGNLDYVEEPKLEFPVCFEVYPPEVKKAVEIKGGKFYGTKRFEYVVVPREPGEFELPGVRFSFFNPENTRYEELVTAPVKVSILSSGKVGERGVEISPGKEGIKVLGEDIRYLKPDLLTLYDQSSSLWRRFWYIGFDIFGFFLVLFSYFFRRHLEKLEKEEGYARKRSAERRANKRLGLAKRMMSEGRKEEFYSELKRALLEYIGDRFNVSPWGMSKEEMATLLDRVKLNEEDKRALFEILARCDAVQFAGIGASSDDMGGLLLGAKRIIRELEKLK